MAQTMKRSDFDPDRVLIEKDGSDEQYFEIKHYDDLGFVAITELQKSWAKTVSMLSVDPDDTRELTDKEKTNINKRINDHFLSVILYDIAEEEELIEEPEGFKRRVIELFFEGVRAITTERNPEDPT